MTGESRTISNSSVRQLRDAIELPDAGERFEVRELIGQGGMGRVYRVYDRVLEREVALKALSLDAETDELAQRLAREARVLARLEHPAIAAIHDAGTLADGRPFYLMRLVRGASLVNPSAAGARGERLRVFLRVCDAVSFAHARGVIHRDLKPGNVMVGEYGDVVVLDWGVAKLLQSGANDAVVAHERPVERATDETRDGIVVGTPGFMAPEQASGAAHSVDSRADVYGLGALLRHLLNEVSAPHASSNAIPRPLSAIIERAMAPAPSARYQHVDDLSADVRRWLDGESVTAYSETALERASRFYQRNRTLLLLLAAYAIVRVTILVWRGV